MKNKVWLYIVLSLLIIGMLQWFTPWWIGCLVLFVVGMFLVEKTMQAFALGWIVLFILWLATALYQNAGSHVSVASSIGDLFGGMPAFMVYLVTAILGGIVGGLAAMTGTLVGKATFRY